MHKISCFFLLTFLAITGYSQQSNKLELESYFSAIIVTDIDASIDWYTTVLGFELKNRFDSEERGFSQSNLVRNGILIELIELEKAVDAKVVIPNYTSKTRLNGLFKIGFRVTDFDSWMAHFEKSEVELYGNIVTDSTTGKKMVIITDPDGNRIQIFER